MSRFEITGKTPIRGEISVQGAKNAVLPILAATIMTEDACVIENCPDLRDVDKTVLVLKGLGCDVRRSGHTVTVLGDGLCDCEVCETLMRQMRSSIIFLGAILTRCKNAVLSMPGGCPIGQRPIDLHLKALRRLGVDVREEHGFMYCRADKITGADIHLDFPSVGATENIMLASVTAEGVTTVSNAAREPEIADLARFLNSMGARIEGAGESVIRIEGVKKLHGTRYRVMPDRIVAATYLIAGAITGGDMTVCDVEPGNMKAVCDALAFMGAPLKVGNDSVHISGRNRLKAVDFIRTMPYPGFPTDIQSPFMSLLAVADGTSIVVENIFENRYRHVDELVRMGADIKVSGKTAVIKGVKELYGATVRARELRGGAALVLAGLCADGETTVENTEYIDRGYERMEDCLSLCGARIRRVDQRR